MESPNLMQWVATYRDGSILKQNINSPDLPYNGSMDTTKVKTYFIQMGDNIICGVDVENKIFIVSGVILHTDLPEGEYQLICFKRVLVVSDGTRVERPCFGLQTNIKGKNHKRIMFANADGTYQIASQL